MRMVDADALMRKFADYVRASNNSDFADVPTWNDAVSLVDSAPTIEAEPVKHGRWIWDNRLGEWYCSECNRIMKPYVVEKSDGEYEMAQPFYCGWCGAKMNV